MKETTMILRDRDFLNMQQLEDVKTFNDSFCETLKSYETDIGISTKQTKCPTHAKTQAIYLTANVVCESQYDRGCRAEIVTAVIKACANAKVLFSSLDITMEAMGENKTSTVAIISILTDA